ncbi:MAG: bifunctional methylenetetrahydrofolate dehydrogenase/methenyltetrahydrofolate cyclohydrolase FolD [Syntrophales bacterium]|nr:bifunctional methylenetetrahydrofolate dehydrogenase/methenyltetrahydrofolate cyclohydrolase FolD [Syntrophales bacterium]MCK9391181.1 bifunctional methylenetetrahydrofolate dehydrogenase/methenyltetrahydrofolate cyclohydrolase FolD [Syntrophales bacterium]
MAEIINGNEISRVIREEIRKQAVILREKTGVTPGLAVVLVGADPASQIYVRRKGKCCEEVGFLSREFRLPENAEEKELLEIIRQLNEDPAIHGILVQLPLPRHIRSQAVIEAIAPQKDVDGFHPVNVGRLVAGNPGHVACTPQGIIELLDRTGIAIEGKEAVIVGRSNIVGKPLALLLLARHATITVCHTRTRNLPEITRRADILVAAAGNPEMIRGEMVKEGAVVIDVGMNRLPDGRLVGDVAFAEVASQASHITPVPGGVGPMTIAMLLQNTLNGARLKGR